MATTRLWRHGTFTVSFARRAALTRLPGVVDENVAGTAKTSILRQRARGFASSCEDSSRKSSPLIAPLAAIAATFVVTSLYFHFTGDKPESFDTADSHMKKLAAAAKESASAVTANIALAKASPISNEVVNFDYVLVGGGTASYHAMLAIRKNRPEADILIVTEESMPPYQRPPLTKELWFTEDSKAQNLQFIDWQGNEASLAYASGDTYQLVDPMNISASKSDERVKIICGCRVTGLNPEEQFVSLENGAKIGYGKLLMSTGGIPKTSAVFEQLPKDIKKHVSTYRTVEDFKRLHALADGGRHILIVGGGFLGSELTCALATRGKDHDVKVTQVYLEEGNMGLVFPTYLTKWTTKRIEELGATVIPLSSVTNIKKSSRGGKLNVQLNDGAREFEVDHVVVSIGVDGNSEVAKSAGLELDEKGGVIANAELEARHNIYVAGDLVSYYDEALGLRRRIEHYDHAIASGTLAGENMVTDRPKAYRYQPMFWSDLGPAVSYEAVGIIDSKLSTVALWEKADNSENAAPESERFDKGVILYKKDSTIVGALMFNIHGKVEAAKELIGTVYNPDKIPTLTKKFGIHQK